MKRRRFHIKALNVRHIDTIRVEQIAIRAEVRYHKRGTRHKQDDCITRLATTVGSMDGTTPGELDAPDEAIECHTGGCAHTPPAVSSLHPLRDASRRGASFAGLADAVHGL